MAEAGGRASWKRLGAPRMNETEENIQSDNLEKESHVTIGGRSGVPGDGGCANKSKEAAVVQTN